MDFQQAETRFKELKAQFEIGELAENEFKAQLEELMVQDTGGNWWMIGYETEKWYRHDGENWVQANPPGITSKNTTPVVTPEPQANEDVSAKIAVQEKEEQEPFFREKDEREPVKKSVREQFKYEPVEEGAYQEKKVTTKKSPFVALLLSFFFLGGVGQIYLGQWKKGITLIIVSFLTSFIFIGFIVNLVGTVDAYSIAEKMNRGDHIGEWEFGFSWKGLLFVVVLVVVSIIVIGIVYYLFHYFGYL